MARRPVFIPLDEPRRFVQETMIDFVWSPGLAVSQKLKNVKALHEAAAERGLAPLLEVSTKSDVPLGQRLSAFNLPVELDDGTIIPLECAFQGSKVFERGGPFRDLYCVGSREAKRDDRLRTSGSIVEFRFEGFRCPTEPKTAFYDWLFARALAPHAELLERLDQYAAFTDIEFNPGKSINCQARSCAVFVSLRRKGLVERVIRTPQEFIETVEIDSFAQPYSDDVRQGKIF
jgi:hypothetical protein